MSRGISLDVVTGVIISERSPPAIRTRSCIMHAASVELLAVAWKLGPEQTGPEPVALEAMTRKGGKDRKKGNSKGKDTEMEKGARFEGYCGHCGERGHRHEDGWSRLVSRVETDNAWPRTWILCPSRHRCR